MLLTIPPPGPERYPDLDLGGLPLPVIIPNTNISNVEFHQVDTSHGMFVTSNSIA